MVETLVNENKFAVDNLPPAFDSTGAVSIAGGENQIGLLVIQIQLELPFRFYTTSAALDGDTTLQNGLIEIQFFNINRGLGWVTIAANDTINESGQDVTYYRNIDSLYAVMDSSSEGNGGIQPGDVIAVRAKVIDKHANVTAFAASTDSLRFDPRGPIIGEIISGVFGTTSDGSTDTVYSSDQIDIAWTSFAEIDPQESGLKEYLFTILKRDSTTAGQLVTFKDTTLTNPPDTSFSEALFLTHGSRYVAQIVGIDTAGNYSDTLSSDTLFRLNSPPVFGIINGETIDEDIAWTKSFDFTDLDLSVLQGDSHTFKLIQ